jgi:hypothetical protein
MRPGVRGLALAVALWAGGAGAQTIAVIDHDTLPRFEVASVKAADPNAQSSRWGVPPGRFIHENMPLFPNTLMM